MINIQENIANLKLTLAGRFIYRFLPYRRKIILANIRQVFANLSKAEETQFIKAIYSHFASCIKEALILRYISKEKLKALVEVRGHEHMLKVIEANKGVLVLTGHFGNWEFAPLGGILNFSEFKGQFHFIRRSLGSKILERILFNRYREVGLEIIPKQFALQKVCDALDKNHAVIFVLDQHASLQAKDGIAVEFFGKKAGTYRSLASLAKHTTVPVVPAASYRLPSGKHVLEFFEPIHWEEHATAAESLYKNTLRYNQAIEKIILSNPEQWIWFHKRWKI